MNTNAEGYRQVATTIPNALYRKIKEHKIGMAVVMRSALEKAVKEAGGDGV